MVHADSTTARLRSIDCLRGIAALAVVFDHAALYGLLANNTDNVPFWFRATISILKQGHLGVPLFFVISGFCIHLAWAKRWAKSRETEKDFIEFWKRRIRRLYVPYVAALTLSMTLVYIGYRRGLSFPLLAYPTPKGLWMIKDFVMHLLMLHGVSPQFDRMGGNPPFWTLAREEYLYALYLPLLAVRKSFNALASTVASFAAGLCFLGLAHFFLQPNSPWFPIIVSSAICLWVQWALGVLAVENYLGIITLPEVFCNIWLVPMWAILAASADRFVSALGPALWGMCFFTLVNNFVLREKQGRWPVRGVVYSLGNWLSAVGVFSYSLYLVHNPVRGVVKYLLPSHGETSSPLRYLAVVSAMVVLCVAAGKLFFVAVEKHFLINAARPTRAAAATV